MKPTVKAITQILFVVFILASCIRIPDEVKSEFEETSNTESNHFLPDDSKLHLLINTQQSIQESEP